MGTPDTKPALPGKFLYWTGWLLTILPVLGLVMSAVFKLLKPPEVLKEFERLGYTEQHATGLGILEIGCTVLYVIPQTSVLGAILLTGYLGGAIATHVRLGEGFAPPVIMGVMIWLGLFLREPRLWPLVPWRK